jgi:uncharacterized protein affecting Mg2+/Co2+ transport
MHTKAHSLAEKDLLRMRVALCAVQIKRHPKPYYQVAYRINLLNDSELSVRLMGRKWLITQHNGNHKIIEAGQVFNAEPILAPGAVFTLFGSHNFSRLPRRMELRLFGKDQLGTPFITPPLSLKADF